VRCDTIKFTFIDVTTQLRPHMDIIFIIILLFSIQSDERAQTGFRTMIMLYIFTLDILRNEAQKLNSNNDVNT
jgi:hypothetical protein